MKPPNTQVTSDEECETNTRTNLDNDAQLVMPRIQRNSDKGITIFASKEDLPIEVVVVDAECELRAFKK